MELKEMKRVYNKLLARAKKAEAYFEDNTISREEHLKWGNAYLKIVEGLGDMIKRIRAAGHDMTREEILDGFKEET
jgi:hypothetical protein